MIMNIYPMDVLLFRDARPFNIEQANANSISPMPSTIAGAIRSKILVHNEMNEESKEFISYGNPDDAEKIDIKGMFFSNEKELFPVPHDIVNIKKNSGDSELSIVRPMQILENTYIGGDYLHFKSPDTKYLSSDEFRFYLSGKCPDKMKEKFPFIREDRIGIEIDNIKGTSDEGKLYRISYLRFKKDIFLKVWFGKDEIKKYIPEEGIMKLGGENKSAYYELKDEKVEFTSNDILNKINENKKFKIYFSTPYVFKSDFENELKQEIETKFGVKLEIKGSVPEMIKFSGWDYKKGNHKNSKNALKEGSVVYFSIISGKISNIEYPLNTGLMKTLGFGCSFIGVW